MNARNKGPRMWGWGLTQWMRELGSYLLWQLPSWLLLALVLVWVVVAMRVEGWIAATIFFLFVVKDVLLFPAMRAAFRHPRFGPRPIGKRAEAIEPLEPSGYVRVDGELWKAEALGPGMRIPAGSTVVVRDARGLILLVERECAAAAGAR